MKSIKFTIITVCYNCKDLVKETLDSLLKQTYNNYEYIIVDGKSTDGTLEEINKYKNKFKQIKIISEKDSGIYDAMNKGIKMATGDFIYFLNMGDLFYNENVLKDVSKNITDPDSIYYGNYMKGSRYIKQSDKITNLFILAEMMICHQTIFAPSKTFDNNLYDTEFKICADRKWLINCIKQKKIKTVHINTIIAIYDPDGISSSIEKVAKESEIILSNYYPQILIKMVFVKRFLAKLARSIIK